MELSKCSLCNKNIESSIIVNLNGENFCPNCMLEYVIFFKSKLPENNIFIDGKDKMELTKDLFIRLIYHNLTKKQFREFKTLYPDNWYLHDDFYDEDGNRLQPVK